MIQISTHPLSNDRLARLAPAIFAEAPHESRSERYGFVPTIAVLDALRAEGWEAYGAGQGRARDVSRGGVQKHLVRMRHPDMMRARSVGEIPELVITNSHDGTTSYQLDAGIFRMVCENGMVVCEQDLGSRRIMHAGGDALIPRVIEASYEVIQDVPRVMERVDSMKALPLSDGERLAFANAAAMVRWEPDKVTGALPVEPASLLRPRRWEDKGTDLWGTLNTVQEHLIRGGVRARSSNGQRRRSREVGSVSEDTRINRALWALADRMQALKTGAPVG